MSMYQANQNNILSGVPSALHALSQVLGHCCEAIYSRWTARWQSRGISKLSPSIRYDIGEIDCRPPASKLQAVQTAQNASLELMRMRSI